MNNKVNNFGDDGKKLEAARKAAELAKANKAKGNEKADKNAETQKTSADKGIDSASVGRARLAMNQGAPKNEAEKLLDAVSGDQEIKFTDKEIKDALKRIQGQTKSGERTPSFTEEQLVQMFQMDEVPTGTTIDLGNPFAVKAFQKRIQDAQHLGNLANDLDITTPQGRQRQAELLRNIIDPRNPGGLAA